MTDRINNKQKIFSHHTSEFKNNSNYSELFGFFEDPKEYYNVVDPVNEKLHYLPENKRHQFLEKVEECNKLELLQYPGPISTLFIDANYIGEEGPRKKIKAEKAFCKQIYGYINDMHENIEVMISQYTNGNITRFVFNKQFKTEFKVKILSELKSQDFKIIPKYSMEFLKPGFINSGFEYHKTIVIDEGEIYPEEDKIVPMDLESGEFLQCFGDFSNYPVPKYTFDKLEPHEYKLNEDLDYYFLYLVCEKIHDRENFDKSLWQYPELQQHYGFPRNSYNDLKTDNPYDARSLIFDCIEQNPEGFDEVIEKMAEKIFEKSILEKNGSISDLMFARLLNYKFGHYFLKASKSISKKKITQYYNFILPSSCDGRRENAYKWMLIEDLEEYHIRFVTFLSKYATKAKMILNRIAKDNKEDVKYCKLLNGRIATSQLNSFDRIESSNGMKHLMNMFEKLILKRYIQNRMDRIPFCVGVENGILNIGWGKNIINEKYSMYPNVDKPTLVNSRNSMYISRCVSVNYYPYDPEDFYVKQVNGILEDVLPNPKVREPFLLFGSTMYFGLNTPNFILALLGGGSNGKSAITDFFLKMSSEKIAKCPKSLFVGAQNPSGPDEAMMVTTEPYTGGVTTELNARDKIEDDKLKHNTGSETKQARGNHGSYQQFECDMSHILVTNHTQLMDPLSCDHGYWRRFMPWIIKIVFTKDPDPGNELEKLANPDVINWCKDKNYRQAFFSIIVHYAMIFRHKYGETFNNVDMSEYEKCKDTIRNKNDHINRFLCETLYVKAGFEKTGNRFELKNEKLYDETYNDEADFITLDHIVKQYFNWYKLKVDNKQPENMTISRVHDIISNLSNVTKYFTKKNNMCYIKGLTINFDLPKENERLLWDLGF